MSEIGTKSYSQITPKKKKKQETYLPLLPPNPTSMTPNYNDIDRCHIKQYILFQLCETCVYVQKKSHQAQSLYETDIPIATRIHTFGT